MRFEVISLLGVCAKNEDERQDGRHGISQKDSGEEAEDSSAEELSSSETNRKTADVENAEEH